MASLKKDENGSTPVWLNANVTTAATTVVKATATVFHGIVINKPGTTDTLTVYSNSAASGTKVATITVATTAVFYGPYDTPCDSGLTVVSGGTAGDYTVLYS